jgi:hypothetical protein
MAGPTNSQRARTVQEATTSLPVADVLRDAKAFFGRQNGIYAAFLEQEGPTYITLRGQGGEEIVIAATPSSGETRVTASSYLFDQQVARFLSNLLPSQVTGPPTPVATAATVPSASRA